MSGSDDGRYYWHDLPTEQKIFGKTIFRFGFSYDLKGFGFVGKTDIVLIDGRFKLPDYQNILKKIT